MPFVFYVLLDLTRLARFDSALSSQWACGLRQPVSGCGSRSSRFQHAIVIPRPGTAFKKAGNSRADGHCSAFRQEGWSHF